MNHDIVNHCMQGAQGTRRIHLQWLSTGPWLLCLCVWFLALFVFMSHRSQHFFRIFNCREYNDSILSNLELSKKSNPFPKYLVLNAFQG